ncbi:uncharacterized protein LOC115345512 [Aquila chrysaetos chrysaetos]|uniref:uncharacterized protein LOC115345512 n=1 Tax=Aquila chrysaetos chrysaetos TaxID=223781 RepID=UPI001177153F|nr:uncharacterized protein LOC115345512 [Aquila chrysaetos chrysaetos]
MGYTVPSDDQSSSPAWVFCFCKMGRQSWRAGHIGCASLSRSHSVGMETQTLFAWKTTSHKRPSVSRCPCGGTAGRGGLVRGRSWSAEGGRLGWERRRSSRPEREAGRRRSTGRPSPVSRATGRTRFFACWGETAAFPTRCVQGLTGPALAALVWEPCPRAPQAWARWGPRGVASRPERAGRRPPQHGGTSGAGFSYSYKSRPAMQTRAGHHQNSAAGNRIWGPVG